MATGDKLVNLDELKLVYDKLLNLTPADLGAKATQSAVSDPTASGTGLTFIDSITQDAQGVITPTKKTVQTATQSANGVMSSTDKAKLDGIATGAQVNSITGVKGNAESSYRTGNVNLTPANIGAVALAGGTMTGDLFFSNSGTSIRQIRGTVGGNDYWRIAGGATAANSGWMEIATADEGNESIYVRQYTGVYSTVKRTLTLLDSSGNTTFPGTVTATGFSGPLTGNVTGNCSGSSGSCTGNAATATNADKLDNYHLNDILKAIYPVGSIYISFNNSMPSVLAAIGTWAAITGGYVLKTVTSGTGGAYSNAGNTGDTTLTVNQIPSHNHGGSTGDSKVKLTASSASGSGGASVTTSVYYQNGNGYTSAFMNESNHSHTITAQGGGKSHNHTAGMPANVAVYMWKRTA